MKDPREEKTLPNREFYVDVSYTILKKAKVVTDDYTPILTEDGRICAENTANTDWKEAYESEHYTVLELLHELEQYINKELCMVAAGSGRGRELQRMKEDVQGWELEEEHYEEG